MEGMFIQKKAQPKWDRFAGHTTNVALWFTRDKINAEYRAVDEFKRRAETGFNKTYKTKHLWTLETNRSEIDRKNKEAILSRNYRVDFPWTSARVDKAEITGTAYRGEGVRTFPDFHDTGATVFARPYGVMEPVPQEKLLPPKPKVVPEQLRGFLKETKKLPWWEKLGLGAVEGQPDEFPDEHGVMRRIHTPGGGSATPTRLRGTAWRKPWRGTPTY